MESSSGKLPASTYRIQLRSGVDFERVAELVPYLQALGVDWLYLSPPFQARPGSSHGYDVVDPNRLDPELGGEPAFHRLCDELSRHRMGLLIDIVPNHMAAHESNAWWWSVLESGAESEHASVFDIDWAAHAGRIHLPVLGEELEKLLERGELRVDRASDPPCVRLFELRLPLSPATPADASLPELLEAQHYRLRFWRGPDPLSYRRFFSISELVGVRAEDPEVFRRTHALALGLVAEGRVQGLRVDHPDGLTDPIGYTELLHSEATRVAGGATPYLVLEKILTDDERLRPELRAHGTTGYDALRLLDALFVDPSGAAELLDTYVRFTGGPRDFEQVARSSKQRVLDTALSPELVALARRIEPLVPGLSPEDAAPALRELISAFPVYRSYVRPGDREPRAEDRRLLEAAAGRARAWAPELGPALTAIAAALQQPAPEAREALLRFQQLTAPAAAKGVEDTALYRWFPLASLCEVGGRPDRFGIEIDEFHRANLERAARWPSSLVATTTHDTKRSEDLRARLHVLSEIPEIWAAALDELSRLNAGLKRVVDGQPAPDANDEYLIYQTLLGVWPLAAPEPELPGRLREYLIKALREAKRSSAWIDPHPDYERATLDFVAALLDPRRSAAFQTALARLDARVSRPAMSSSLSRTVLKAACPGVPDYYQGSELWDRSLVDPDNRRPVDWALRARLLEELGNAPDAAALLEHWRDGRIKLWVTAASLRLCRRRAELFARGAYLPARIRGPAADRVVAFVRVHGREAVLAAAGRFFTSRERRASLELPAGAPAGEYRDVLSGQSHRVDPGAALDVGRLFAQLPCALLEKVG